MYKVDIKTLNEITKTLDAICNKRSINSFSSVNSEIDRLTKAIKKGRALSAKIKKNYTEIQP